MPSNHFSPFLRTAIEAARAGEKVIQRYYQHNVQVQLKADQTPVTVADVETEKAIKAVLQAAFPAHGFYGEETGREGEGAEYVWLVDPIDGTKSFVRQYPFFSTQIALLRGGEFILGVSNAPLFGELAYAERGFGAWLNGKRLAVSDLNDFGQATLSTGNLKTLAADRARWPALGDLIPQFNRVRGYGDFYHYHLLAAGKIDAVLESDVAILDVAALSVLVAEAGGRVTDLYGKPLTLDSTTILASNGRLHDSLLSALNP
ncbi:MAG TPA: inositol monophosphatase family protein [Candidatus Competibacteraceae bacterium]|nr:inositol monophosphatase family protein [Candidatus Competibacteraceae bacterium]